MNRTLPVVSLVSLLTLGTPALSLAQPVMATVQFGVARGPFQRSFDEGYRSGLRSGERDARSGRRPDFRLHADYRRGTRGWGHDNSAGGDAFRRGFARGYGDGYDRVRISVRPGHPSYRRPGVVAPPRGGYAYSPAAQRGFDDGYRDGRNDARDGDRYEPLRKKKYRNGDEGYSNRFGSRERYKIEYRQAFRDGYDSGYRDGR
ncbi:MAG: hypothetical protein IT182_14865 [Acidobacteria bacterium]|nr:hypothetical protein [Acidobacteriota bacterium]